VHPLTLQSHINAATFVGGKWLIDRV